MRRARFLQAGSGADSGGATRRTMPCASPAAPDHRGLYRGEAFVGGVATSCS